MLNNEPTKTTLSYYETPQEDGGSDTGDSQYDDAVEEALTGAD